MTNPEREKQFIVDYMASQASDETVEHLEKVASERVLGRQHDVWDVHTDAERWWVITEPTNLYSQKQFPSMSIALTFHVGLMAQVWEQNERRAPAELEERFAEAWRKWEQAGEALNHADEAEEFQAVGMRCRESLISFVQEAARTITLDQTTQRPKASDFIGWTDLIANIVASGASAERRRGYLKSAAKSTWELVQWLTHSSNATRFDAYFALQATGHVMSAFSLSWLRLEHGVPDRCPRCNSYRLASDYSYDEHDSLQHYTICEVCGWETSSAVPADEQLQDGSALADPSPDEPQDLGPCVFVEVPLRGPKPPKPSHRRAE